MSIHFFLTETEAVQTVLQWVEDALKRDIQQRGEASLVLTGGKSVQPFLTALAALPIAWSQVWIVLSDERWLPVDQAASNEKQLKTLFLDKLRQKPRYISLKTDHTTPFDAIPSLKTTLSVIPMPITMSLLSMGEDGHIASLFPKEPWGEGLTHCFKNGNHRISLSLDFLKRCNHNVLLVKKERKSLFETIRQNRDGTQAIDYLDVNTVVY